MQVLENAVNDIEAKIQNSLAREVSTEKIGEYAMAALKVIDEVAYVRFASVHKHFSDINSFMSALQELLEEK